MAPSLEVVRIGDNRRLPEPPALAHHGAMLGVDNAPFVLLDDARPGGAAARLYRNPASIVQTDDAAAVRGALDEVRAGQRAGLHAAGFLAYEAAAGFEPTLPPAPCPTPLLWFGLFERWQEVPNDAIAALLPNPRGVRVGAPRPAIEQADYDRRIAAVLALIAAGDLYQANLTFQAEVAILGDPLAAYAAIRRRAAAGWGGVVATGRHLLLSFSPELFFTLERGTLTCRPMKGTARPGATPAEDAAIAARLAADPKQRAENLMIVDLMRNDLSRVAVPGSVEVPRLFEVERYPTVHQMVSTVTATLAEGRDAADVLAAAFPCGSITGAPKLRAIAALREIEQDVPRGPYTGAIGHIDADGDARFNVAIRTLRVDPAEGTGRLGLGSGIVADSRAVEEWDECLAKGDFLTAGQRAVDLIETMAFDPEIGILRLDRHLARMKASARALGITFDRHGARNELQAATFRLRATAKIRLLLAPGGAIAIEVAPLPAAPDHPMPVALVPLPVAASDYRLRHKTSDRRFYDAARRAAGTPEVVFVRPDGQLTEGSFTSLFVERDGRLLTPPLAAGLLPGVLRGELIEEGRAEEAPLTAADLSGGFLVGNAVRGLMPAVVAVAK